MADTERRGPGTRSPGGSRQPVRWRHARRAHSVLHPDPARRLPPRAGQQLLGCPAPASYGTAASSLADSALSRRASAFRLSLDPLTPPLRSARRDTGFPAVASLRAIKDA